MVERARGSIRSRRRYVFITVAATPSNVYRAAHNAFVMWAFRTFLLAVVLDGIAILRERELPQSFAFVFVAFSVRLAAYVLLLTIGPAPNSHEGLRVQVLGPKILVYASVVSVLIQALVADSLQRRLKNGGAGDRKDPFAIRERMGPPPARERNRTFRHS